MTKAQRRQLVEAIRLLYGEDGYDAGMQALFALLGPVTQAESDRILGQEQPPADHKGGA